MTETRKAEQMRNYTVLARRTPQHSKISLQTNDRAMIGERIWYRGMWLTVTDCQNNQTGNWLA